MIAYLDASVVLRIVLGQRDALAQWPQITQGVASSLTEIECLRTLDRLRPSGGRSDTNIGERREAIYRLLDAVEVVRPTDPVLARASLPLPTALGTLDAIHLATATLWKEQTRKEITMATHDRALAIAAKATGLRVIGT